MLHKWHGETAECISKICVGGLTVRSVMTWRCILTSQRCSACKLARPSVLRETKNARLVLQYALHMLGIAAVAGGLIVYTGDCFPAVHDLLKMKGLPKVQKSNSYMYLQLNMMWMLIAFNVCVAA